MASKPVEFWATELPHKKHLVSDRVNFATFLIIDCHSYLDHLVMRWSCSICDEFYHNPRSFNDHDEIEHLGIQKKSLNGNCSMCNYPIKSDVHGGESIR